MRAATHKCGSLLKQGGKSSAPARAVVFFLENKEDYYELRRFSKRWN